MHPSNPFMMRIPFFKRFYLKRRTQNKKRAKDFRWTPSSCLPGRLRELQRALQMPSPWVMTRCHRWRCRQRAPAALMLRGQLGGSTRHCPELSCGSGWLAPAFSTGWQCQTVGPMRDRSRTMVSRVFSSQNAMPF